jgi:DNA-directed RNA polymerase subunit RPC12/RpoP
MGLKMTDYHTITARYTMTEVTCGNCGKTFDDKGQNELTNTYPVSLYEGEWVECPHCKSELEVYEYDEDGEDCEEEE